MYIGFFTPDKCRSFCCIKICEYLENAIILLQFTIFPLNTDKMARTWKTSTVSFEDCTKTGYLYGEEKFLDYFVVPKISLPENLGKFVSFVGTSYNGPMYCALTMIHGSGNYYGGIVFSYDPACTARQFRYSDGVYGFRTI